MPLESTGVLRIKLVEGLLEDCPEELKVVIGCQLRIWESLNEEIRTVEAQMRKEADEVDRMYQSIPGVGPITSRTLASELGDLSRFETASSLACYTGLTPSEYSSGETVKRGKISRQGNGRLRGLLVEAAWIAIRYDEQLYKFYGRICQRAGSTKAIVAVARKLLTFAHAMFKSGTPYKFDRVPIET